MPRRRLAALATVAALLALTGCGGSSDVDTQVVTESIVDPGDLPDVVIDQEDLDRFDPGSVERAFLNYSEALQFGDVAAALEFYDPGLLRAVGERNVTAGLRFGSPIYRSRKPGIFETSETEGGIETIRYLLQDLSGQRSPYSISWRKRDGEWVIVFNAYLGDSMKTVVQAREQAALDPSAQAVSPEAERAGARVAARQEVFYDGLLAGD